MPLLEKEKSWELFDKISPTYDRTNRILSFGLDKLWRKKLSSYLPERSSLSILDIATGTGDQLGAFLKSKKPIKKAVGIDLSEEMLALARKKFPFPNVQFLKEDGQNLPFLEESFDLVSISFGIRNIPNIDQALQEMHRVLKEKSPCLILEFSLPKNPLLQKAHLFYLRNILPSLGGWLSNNKKAYQYLNETIEEFPYGKAFCRLMEKAGFKQVFATPLLGGIVHLYRGEK